MEKFDPIDIDFVINSDEVKAATNKVKTDLKSVGQTAEETSAKVNTQLKGAFARDDNAAAVAALNKGLTEQGTIITRNKPAYNGLGNSINQISREMSAFTVSAQTGFLAISNNIPILADEINRLKAKNAELTASGQKAVPVWKQVVSGLFSWQTALSVGITLLTIYGKDMVEFIANLFTSKDAIKSNSEALKEMGDKAVSSIGNLKALVGVTQDITKSEEDRLKAIRDINKEYPEFNTNILTEKDNTKLLNAEVDRYIGLLVQRARLKATEEEIGNATIDLIALEEKRGKLEKKLADDNAIVENERVKRLAEIQVKLNKYDTNQVDRNKLIQEYDKSYQYLTGTQNTYLKTLVSEIEAREKLDGLINTAAGLTEGGPQKGTIAYYEELISANNKLIQTKKTVNDIDEVRRIQRENEQYQKQIDLISNKKSKTPDTAKVVSDYQSLLDKLSDLDKEYSRKSFTKDEEELQALRDKFDKIRTLVERFNADPKNKAQIIDLSNLDKLEVKAEASLTYRQTTEKLKDELAEQQKLFAEFETYKSQFGIEAAKKEYAGRIGEATNYYEFLKQKQKENEASYTAVQEGTAIGGEIERVQLLNKAIVTEATKQKKLFDEQLAQLKDYQAKRTLLIEKYEATRAKLVAAGKKEETEELDRQHEEELNDLDDANIKKLKSYTQLFEGVKDLSVKEAKVVIANAKELIKVQNISAELKAKILKQIAETEKLLVTAKFDTLNEVANAVGSLANALNSLGSSVGNSALSNAGNFLSGLASGASSLLNTMELMDGQEFGDLSGADQASVVSSGIQGAIGLVTMFTSAAAQRKATEEAYYLSVIGYQNDYNLALNEQIRLQSILDENVFIKDYEGRVKDALESIQAANVEYQKSIDKLAELGEVKIGQRSVVDAGNVGSGIANGALLGAAVGSVVPVVGTVIGAIGGAVVGAIAGLFGGKKNKDQYGDILGEYPELIQQSKAGVDELNVALAETLIANEFVNGETKEILETIIAWQKELDTARAQIKEVISELSGGLGTDLKTMLVDAFVAGEDAALKMGDTVEAVLENILSSLIFNNIFSNVFDDLEAQMAESFDVGGDGTWVDDFGRFFTQASALTEDFNAAMEAAQQEAANFGFNVFKPEEATNTGLTGAIQRSLTEATGSELTGLFRGQYDVTKRMLEAAEVYYEKEQQYYANFLNLLAINTAIRDNTASTVTELQLAVIELKKIADNTDKIYLNDIGA